MGSSEMSQRSRQAVGCSLRKQSRAQVEMSLGHDSCSAPKSSFDPEIGFDPNGPPVPLHCDKMKAGCPVEREALSGGGLGSGGLPRWTIMRYALNAIPYVGNVLASLVLPAPSNLAAVVASQEDMERATTTAFGAILAQNTHLMAAFADLLRAAVGDSRNPGYITTCGQIAAQDLDQKLTLIVINAIFLSVMLIASIWALG